MAAPVSFLIATRGQAQTLVPCLQGLMAGLDSGVLREVIFHDPAPDPVVAAIAEESGAEIAGSVGEAIGRAQGRWICLLPARARLPGTWPRGMQAALALNRPVVLHPGPVPWFAQFRRGGIPMFPNDPNARELNLTAMFRGAPHRSLSA